MWINGEISESAVGSVGFLIERRRDGGGPSHHISGSPAHTNQSHEPRLFGWCGTTNNVATYALGLVRVTGHSAGGRLRVRRLANAEQAAALESLGWPELAE
jgi:hypothetical protein